MEEMIRTFVDANFMSTFKNIMIVCGILIPIFNHIVSASLTNVDTNVKAETKLVICTSLTILTFVIGIVLSLFYGLCWAYLNEQPYAPTIVISCGLAFAWGLFATCTCINDIEDAHYKLKREERNNPKNLFVKPETF